jgi:hypothetical protein
MPIPAHLTEDDVQTIERDLDSIERRLAALEEGQAKILALIAELEQEGGEDA